MTRIARDRRGVLAAELALLAPVVVLIMLGIADAVMFLRAQVRLETAAMQVGQTVSQCTRISHPGDTSQLWALAQAMVGNVADVRGGGSGGGAVVITAVRSTSGANTVAWQVRTGSASLASAIGTAGGAATVPGTFVIPDGQLLLVTEVIAPVQPWALSGPLMGTGIVPQVLGGTSMYLSRLPEPATMQQAPSSNNAMVCMS